MRLVHDEADRLRALHHQAARRVVRHVADLVDRRLDGDSASLGDVRSPLTTRLTVPRDTPASTATSCTVARLRRAGARDMRSTVAPEHLTRIDRPSESVHVHRISMTSLRVNLCTFTELSRDASSPESVIQNHRQGTHELASGPPGSHGLGPGFAHEGIAFGCDYNPEQWDPSVWAEDVALMREAGRRPRRRQHLRLVAASSRGPGEYDFADLDTIIELLHAGGIRVNLGTGTSSPPPWLTTLHPEILPATADGTTRFPAAARPGARARRCSVSTPSPWSSRSPQRYGDHPAVALWHVSNELGCHNALCYCDDQRRRVPRLAARAATASIDDAERGLGHRASGASATATGPRSDAAARPCRAATPARSSTSTGSAPTSCSTTTAPRLDVLRRHSRRRRSPRTSWSPRTSATSTTGRWAPEVDVIANDHYLDHRLDDPTAELAFAADLTRGLAGGRPWMLMEQSTGAVNWQPHNLAKAPGRDDPQLADPRGPRRRRRSASSSGAPRPRAPRSSTPRSCRTPAPTPRSGARSLRWATPSTGSTRSPARTRRRRRRPGVQLGVLVGRRRRDPPVAVACATSTRCTPPTRRCVSWASPSTSSPRRRPRRLPARRRPEPAPGLRRRGREHHRLRRRRRSRADHLLQRHRRRRRPGAPRRLPGRVPRAARHPVEEFCPLLPGDSASPSTPAPSRGLWTERLRLDGGRGRRPATPTARPRHPAVTRNTHGAGTAWYLATALEAGAYRDLMRDRRRSARASTALGPEGDGSVEIVRRASADRSYLFVINHGTDDIERPGTGHELVTGDAVTESLRVPAGAVRVDPRGSSSMSAPP